MIGRHRHTSRSLAGRMGRQGHGQAVSKHAPTSCWLTVRASVLRGHVSLIVFHIFTAAGVTAQGQEGATGGSRSLMWEWSREEQSLQGEAQRAWGLKFASVAAFRTRLSWSVQS